MRLTCEPRANLIRLYSVRMWKRLLVSDILHFTCEIKYYVCDPHAQRMWTKNIFACENLSIFHFACEIKYYACDLHAQRMWTKNIFACENLSIFHFTCEISYYACDTHAKRMWNAKYFRMWKLGFLCEILSFTCENTDYHMRYLGPFTCDVAHERNRDESHRSHVNRMRATFIHM